MTKNLEDYHLSKNKLRSIIKSARQVVEPKTNNVKAEDYDWEKPHHYDPDNLIALEMFNKKVSKQFERVFETLCQGEYTAKITEINQDYACHLSDIVSSEKQDYYFLTFIHEDKEDCGFIEISPETARFLVAQMLRETDSSLSEGRSLSELEETILLDMMSSLVDAVASVYNQSTYTIQRGAKLGRSGWPVEFHELEDLTTLIYEVSFDEGSVKIPLIILSNAMDPIVGIQNKQGHEATPEEISNVIMKQMHKAPVKVEARICTSTMYLKDLMNLQVNDVMLLKKKIHEPCELLLNNKPCLNVYPVSCMGKYAVMIGTEEE